jgi:ankyrin repeat protein
MRATFKTFARNWGHHARKASTFSQALSQAVVNVLTSKTKVNVLSQGLLAIKRFSSHSNYSQQVRRRMTGLHLTAYFGVETVIKLLLDTGKVDADWKDEGGRTPLFWTADKGLEAVVKLLLKKGSEVGIESRGGWTPLQLAALNRHEG